MLDLETHRHTIRTLHRADEKTVTAALISRWAPSTEIRERSVARAATLAAQLRASTQPSPMEAFLGQYGLSTKEGVALMCLAEALLRVPDADTIDALIDDKIAPHAWAAHLGKAASPLVNASTWALMLTGKVLDDDTSEGITGALHGALKRLGEPVIRLAVEQAMKALGKQFVLGRTIKEAQINARPLEADGYSYSYDMLGEAAITAADADRYFSDYRNAIAALAKHAEASDCRYNPGISVKLSALHPRYDALQRGRVLADLVPRVAALARSARDANIGFNIDAEEADRLDLSLDVIEAVVRDPALADWDGFGVVVQAYSKRASAVIAWVDCLAQNLGRTFMVRLVKGAYWDTEIKHAQVEGVTDYPVFSQKHLTDIAYICCANQLLTSPNIYPQFATHNAHSVAAILEMAAEDADYEFQRLHGMGEEIHDAILTQNKTRCRIYAPVGAHRDLLAYLVRRLLENGANSSFVNQITDSTVPIETVVADPFGQSDSIHAALPKPPEIFAPQRQNSQGWDIHAPLTAKTYNDARAAFSLKQWRAKPLLVESSPVCAPMDVFNPADPADCVGSVSDASASDVQSALEAAAIWDAPAGERARTLRRAADLFEGHHGAFFAVLAREAGKTAPDAIGELREAVDFLRYYADAADRLDDAAPRGIITCISPWNFPLAIYTGQISAALAAGNGVLAKPAEPTPITAYLATQLLHEAGIPLTALQFLPGPGAEIGAALAANSRVSGVCFTGSTQTAQRINKAMSGTCAPSAPLVAETGGLNAMIVDSTALPEQAVRDIVASAFQSAGQRCSALRLVYVQADVAESFLAMLKGAMDELAIGQPWAFATDVGPVISQDAQRDINAYIDTGKQEGRVLKQLDVPDSGHFVRPSLISVSGIDALSHEVFGPVLHVATFKAGDIDDVLERINARGYGLTFGLHSRIDDRVAHVVNKVKAGNIYINRNQIGAVVGSQPFGGEGLSGTGPKAGGPHYVPRFCEPGYVQYEESGLKKITAADLQKAVQYAPECPFTAISTLNMPGPTGESNRLSVFPRGKVLCLGPGPVAIAAQIRGVEASGSVPVAVNAAIRPDDLETLTGIDAVIYWGAVEIQRAMRSALARRDGPILPFIADTTITQRCQIERHACVDTTAAGGNTALLTGAEL